MTDTSALRAFIEARLDDDEQGARNALSAHWRPDGVNSCQVFTMAEDFSTRTIAWCKNGHDDDFANAIHIARHDPARVLREVAAKRAMVELAAKIQDLDEFGANPRLGEVVLRRLASVWSDRQDFRPEWSTT